MTTGPGGELVDIVDWRDEVIETVTRAQMRLLRLRHRAVFVVVMSARRQVLLHRRSDAKDLWPSRWDLAVGGVVASGESYEDAAIRELAEEVGVTGVVPRFLGAGRYEDGDVALVGYVYVVRHDGPFTFADGEVVEATFVDATDIRRRIATESFVPDSVALVLPLLTRAHFS